jgi:phage terminase large subunit-like protein
MRGPWIDDYLEEVCRFPHAAHYDQVDAVSLAVQMLDQRRSVVYAF